LEKHSVSRLSYLFAHLHLLSSDLSLLSASSLLCFSSVHIVGSLTSKLPSINISIKSLKKPSNPRSSGLADAWVQGLDPWQHGTAPGDLTLWLDHGHGGAGAVPPVFLGTAFLGGKLSNFFLKMTGKFQTILDTSHHFFGKTKLFPTSHGKMMGK
jgi:hypothetical protein